ncbi:MAG: hypothetical protein ACOC2W_01605 [bacterium]
MIFRIKPDTNKIIDFRSDIMGYFDEEMEGYIFCNNLNINALELLNLRNDLNENNVNEFLIYRPDITEIDILTFEETVDILKNKKLKILDEVNKKYITEHYELPRQISFTTLKFDAIAPKLDGVDITGTKYEDAYNKLEEIKNWVFNYPMTYYYQQEAIIKQMAEDIKNNLENIETLESIENAWDYFQFDEFDPKHEIGEIFQILNS